MPKIGMAPFRRSQVINAVFAQVAENGLEDLTLERIATRAGVSKGVVSYYFKNKKQLLLDSFRAFLESYNQEIVSHLQEDMTARDMARVIIQATLRPSPDRPPSQDRAGPASPSPALEPAPARDDYPKVLFHFFQKAILDKEFRDITVELFASYFEGTTRMIEYGMERGEFAPQNAAEAAYGLLVMLDGILLHRAIGFRPLAPEAAEGLCRSYVDGLANKKNNPIPKGD